MGKPFSRGHPLKFSLILATIGRTDELGRFLDSLNAQTYRDFELVIVDQNEDDRVTDVLHPYQDSMKFKHLRSAPGLSRARNVGLRHVSGDIVCFPDDDCWYPEDLLERVAGWFKANVCYPFMSGCYSKPGVKNSSFPFEPMELKISNVFGKRIKFSSITLFLRRDVFISKGYSFNEDLGAGTGLCAGEETDLILRVMEDGYLGKYDPDIVIFHEISRESDTRTDIRLMKEKAYLYILTTHALKLNAYLIIKTIASLTMPFVQSVFSSESFLVARYRIKGFVAALQFKLARNKHGQESGSP
jgi:glycosyltransferase involved in cell wall biosynthesis